jgi:hypothetical protein
MLALWGGLASAQLLGPLMSHEIGHLLLGSNDSSEGIMHDQWGPEEIKRAVTDRLVFTPQQAAMIRANVQARKNQLEIGEGSQILAEK